MRLINQILISGLLAGIGLSSVQAAELKKIDLGSINRPAKTAKANSTSVYIVQMKHDPVITYSGYIPNYRATKPGMGQKVDPNSVHVRNYAGMLEEEQNEAIKSVNAERIYNYRFAFNGFAARMTEEEAAKIEKRSDVIAVWKDEIRQIQTDGSPSYIGITKKGQAWANGLTGEGVVIGSIDTGIWPENPSFADEPTPEFGNTGPKIPYDDLDSFVASGCDFGNTAANPLDAPFTCNNKLLSATCFNSGFSTGPDASNPCGGNGVFAGPHEFQSARDVDGHGSHTAGTAGGNYGVAAYINGVLRGIISGVAPRARIATYKVCWDGPDLNSTADDGCASSDSMMAIDQAVADGVDVINFSVGGPSNSFAGPDDLAFLFAADAGVWVATSAGNAGPGAGTVGTPSGVPWITATGATQDNGVFYSAVVVNAPAPVAGDYVSVEGAGPVTLEDTGSISGPVTLASTFTACFSDGPLDPISGIALVSRGTCSFSEKYDMVAAAGADAIIVFNDGATSSRIDPFVMSAPGTTIPGVMIGYYDGMTLAGAGAVNATLDPATAIPALERIAEFSSRGPNHGAPDIIKPDLAAPGVAILAAGSPALGGGPAPSSGEMFQSINGTSMASPHVAGSFALLKQMHPNWSPAIARSALMTTATSFYLRKSFGETPADPFDIGAGEIRPSDATDPGLAYHAGFFDYLAMLCGEPAQAGLVSPGTCSDLAEVGYSLDPSDLNLPSIGIAELVGTQTVVRFVDAVYNDNGSKTFNVSVDAPPGIDVSVTPSTITLENGQWAAYAVTFTANSKAQIGEWVFGSLTWNGDGGYSVRSPLAVNAVAFSTVDEVDGVADGAGDGSVEVPVHFGYNGPYSTAVSGLEESVPFPGNVADGGFVAWCFDIPANTMVRFATFDSDTSDPGSDDIDLDLYLGNGPDCASSTALAVDLGGSGGFTSEEVVDVANGPSGAYIMFIDGFAASNGTDTDFTLWVQPVFGDNGNTSVTAPASAVSGTSDTVTVDYTGLNPGTRYLGVLKHVDGAELGQTILNIDTQ